MFRLKLSIQHIFNPLHVYCRLTPIVGKERAIEFARRYESFYAMLLA